MNKRNERIDYLKGLSILLVVYGHSIQYCIGPEEDFFLNPIFKLIYTFHMPLFMMISGYLYYNTIQKRSEKELIFRRFKQLIVPAFIWYTIYSIFIISIKYFILNRDIMVEINKYIEAIPYQFWFLYILFYMSCIVVIGNKIFKDNIIYYITLYMILITIPDILNIQFLKFMYPYFLIGYFYKKYHNRFVLNKRLIIKVSMILFFILLLGWKKDYYIYISGMQLYNVNVRYQIFIILYRYVIGGLGSILIIELCDKINSFDRYMLMAKIGKHTLGIYIIQTYIFMIIERINIYISNFVIYNFIFTPILSVIVILISLTILRIIDKSHILNKFLLGKLNSNNVDYCA